MSGDPDLFVKACYDVHCDFTNDDFDYPNEYSDVWYSIHSSGDDTVLLYHWSISNINKYIVGVVGMSDEGSRYTITCNFNNRNEH